MQFLTKRDQMIFRTLVLLFMAVTMHAVQITPTTVSASSTFYTYNVQNLINDSGLSGGLHDAAWQNMWISDTEIPATLTFDLGDRYDLNSTEIWQYSGSPGTDRGVQNFDIYVSDDDVTYTLVTSAVMTQATVTPLPAQETTFTATGRYVRFVLNTNFGSGYIGLAEVKFNGDLAGAAPSVSVPLFGPFAMLLIAGLFGFLGVRKIKMS